MTRHLVEITFGNAIRQANELEACADEMVRLARTNIPGIKNDITAAWQGSSANAYAAKMDLSAENIATTANKLYQIASALRSVARLFRDSELRAIELAQLRDF